MMAKRKSRRPNPRQPCPLDVMDEAVRRCRTIAALAELLAHCEIERLEPRTISISGALIVEEAEKLRQSLIILGPIRLSRPSSR